MNRSSHRSNESQGRCLLEGLKMSESGSGEVLVSEHGREALACKGCHLQMPLS